MIKIDGVDIANAVYEIKIQAGVGEQTLVFLSLLPERVTIKGDAGIMIQRLIDSDQGDIDVASRVVM